MTNRIVLLAVALLAALIGSPAVAQSFPSRPITIIVPFPPGGVTDPVARAVAAKMADSVGQNVVVDNRPGAAGIIACELVKRAPADGYTILFGHFATHAVNPFLYSKLPYDPLKDFEAITPIISTQSILVVHPDSAAKTPQDLVAMAKAKPGGLTFASQGIGAGGHLQGEMFKAATGAPFTHVAYKGSGPALQDMLANRVDLFFDALITAGPLVREGKLRALAITSRTRSPLFPNLATMEELGYPNMELDAWFGMFAPAGTPSAIVAKLNEEFVKAIREPTIAKRFTDLGLDVVTSSPQAFVAKIVADQAKLGPVVKASGAKAD